MINLWMLIANNTEAVLPTVTTASISSITDVSASGGGNVTDDGGANITARGVCWSTSQNPTVSDSHTTDGTGTGPFTSSITGLSASTTYYVRAYATNSAGTSYGSEVSFQTEAESMPTYYVDVDGTDSAEMDGSISEPWATLAYAVSRVTSGDLIHMNAGTWSVSSQIAIPVGISVEGEGVTSIISSTVGSSNYTILLQSTSQGTNGNQSISNLKFTGNSYTAYGAIKVNRRSNVVVNNCTFEYFDFYGCSFNGNDDAEPSTYATGNEFHNNIVTNCSKYSTNNRDGLEVNGQDGMLIYSNSITCSRADNLNGNCIGGVDGFIKNVKIYDNTLTKTFVSGTTPWDFAIEFWDWEGGNEIYNNTIVGSIDVGGYTNNKGSSTYSVWIHHNTIGQTALMSSGATRGVLIESTTNDVVVEKNKIENVATGVYFTQVASACTVSNIKIHYNIFTNIGVSDSGSNYTGWGINWEEEDYHDHTVDNITIYNNVIIGSTGARSNMWGIKLPNIGTVTNIRIRNNIIMNFDYAPIYGNAHGEGESIDNLFIQNNIYYNNGNSNALLLSGITPTNFTNQNNIIDNPDFVSSSDFHLTSSSPAINAGIDVDLLTDYDEVTVGATPEIGCYEYV